MTHPMRSSAYLQRMHSSGPLILYDHLPVAVMAVSKCLHNCLWVLQMLLYMPIRAEA